jgi:hypothetical protein
MRAFQFWVLVFASIFVSGLMIKQIFLSREVNQQQRTLADCQEVVNHGAAYENAWKQLAMRIYQSSRQDPALAAILKYENVEVHANPAANAGSTTPTTAPSVPQKAPLAPPHPATP